MIKQLHGLTSIRFFLALWVVFFHNSGQFKNTEHLYQIINTGYVAVSGFFLLSGFILAYNYEKELNLKSYFINRFARLYPLYLFTLIVDFPLFLYYEYKTNPEYLQTVIEVGISAIIMIQSWNFSWLLHLNPPTWSLSVEAFLYMLFPSLLVLLKFKSHRFLIILQGVIYVVFMICLSSYITKMIPNIDTKPFIHIPTFIIGIIGGLLFTKEKFTIFTFQNKINSSIILSITIISLFVFIISTSYGASALNLGILIPFYLIVFYLLANNRDLLSSKILIRLGEISYAIYLLHWPLRSYITLFYKYVGIKSDEKWFGYLQFGIYLSLLILISNFVYLYLELPLHKKLKYKFVKND